MESGANGERLRCSGYTNLNVTIGPIKFKGKFWIFEMNPELIIGRDLIAKHHIIIEAAIVVGGIEIALSMDKATSPAKAKQMRRWEELDCRRRWEAAGDTPDDTSARQRSCRGMGYYPARLTETQTSLSSHPNVSAAERMVCL